MTLTADPRSLRVRRGHAAACRRSATRRRPGIAQTIDEEVLKGGAIEFRSTRVERAADAARRRRRARAARRHAPARRSRSPRRRRPPHRQRVGQADRLEDQAATRRCSARSRSPTSSRSRSTPRLRQGAHPMVELDHAFETGKPTDYNWERDPRPRPDHPVRRGRQRASSATSRRAGQGRDQGQDGRDVDDVPRHRGGRRARRRGAPRRAARQVAATPAAPGYANADVTFDARRRRRRRSTPRRRSPARRRRWARASCRPCSTR